MKNSECYGNNIWTIPDRLILLVLKNCENLIYTEFMELALEVLRKKDRSNSAKRKIRPNFNHKHNFLSFKTFRAPYKGLAHIIISYGRVTLNYFAIFQNRAVESGMRWAVSTFFWKLASMQYSCIQLCKYWCLINYHMVNSLFFTFGASWSNGNDSLPIWRPYWPLARKANAMPMEKSNPMHLSRIYACFKTL